MTAFWSAAAGKLVERWFATGLAASVYWLTLSVLWALGSGRPREEAAARLRAFGGLDTGEQVALLLIGSVVLAGSGLLIQQLTLPALQLLEGYWPRWAEPVNSRLRERHIRRAAAYEAEADPLRRRRLGLTAADGGGPPLDRDELVRLGGLEERLRWTPRAERVLATSLGNVLRAAETEPLDKYGLDAMVLWPHLWTLLPDGLRQDLAAARRRADSAVAAGVWGLLLLPAVPRTPWALLALPYVYVMWRGVLPGACREFGLLIGTAFDLHRGDLYRALRHPLPADAAAEIPAGERLTAAVFGGSDDPALRYVPDP
ncbi:hypothetical protein J2X68_000761 [Streptomyces sp. 3330]|uniref:hypothetical protein n=1 Tax=Streptomyces sp. 3330 TaxID=2817755 RepID=UPI00286797FB|nr:hypothetical protein [Streptomyces sp. 3330]MDR6974083.1 hypothetical protein [Streptomyces sp. 3330]